MLDKNFLYEQYKECVHCEYIKLTVDFVKIKNYKEFLEKLCANVIQLNTIEYVVKHKNIKIIESGVTRLYATRYRHSTLKTLLESA